MRHYKIIVLLLSVFALITGCTNNVDDVFTNNNSTTSLKGSSNLRSYSEALEIAQNAISILDKNGQQTRSGYSRTVDFKEQAITICAGNRISTRSSGSNGNDTLMYVFNYTDNNGFAVVSADKGTEGLIAVTESGHYDPSDTTDTGFRRYMTAAKYYIMANQAKAKTEPDRAPKGFFFEYDTIGVTNIAPRINVKWGQTGHEGQFCSNNHSGCTITAVAMIMSYFEYPTGIYLTYNEAPFFYRSLNWSGMKDYVINRIKINNQWYYHDVDTCTNENHKSIGYLCRQLGELTNSFYGGDGTETSAQGIRNIIAYLGYTVGDYSSYQNLANTNTLQTLLSEGKLIFMRGENNYYTHAWAIDGYYGYIIRSRYYEYGFTNGHPDPPILMDEQFITYQYNHINWGLDGYNNGYFNDGVFSVWGDPYEYDSLDYVYSYTPTDIDVLVSTYQDNLNFFSIYYSN